VTVPNFAQLLRERRESIIALFVAEVQRNDLAPAKISRSLLIDHIPKFLDEIATELEHPKLVAATGEGSQTNETARQHGEQRWGLGYDLETLILEYGVLRHCILQITKESAVTMSLEDFDALAKCLSVGVAEAASEYIKYRDRERDEQRKGLEFLAEAGQLLASSLDYRSTLSRLMGLLVPRMADWCAIHLETSDEEMPVLHVDAPKTEVLRELYRRFPPRADGAHGHRRVVATGEAELVTAIEPGHFELVAQSKEHLELLQSIDSRSWIIVPLHVQGNVFGALTLAYSGLRRKYTPQDLILASDVARRAAVAIDNARLYDLSQKERARVEAATRAKDEFVAMVSHELRTPLTAILGWMRLIRSGSLDEQKQQHAFEVIERNALAQGQLVADLLDISRVITGKIRINPSQVDLSNVIDMAVEGVRPAAQAKRIEIEVDLDREHSVLRGDGDRLQQVAWNLLANAVKFTPKNGVVRVYLRSVDSELELTVADSGEGIPPSFLPHVFESFRQSDGGSSRSHGGLGIGLSIAKHIIELHGGTIVAKSDGRGRGATFVVRLPISPLVSTTVGVSRVPATKHEAVDLALPNDLGGLRVLVVDDEPDARDLVAYVLEMCGIEVRSAGSAFEAMTELSSYTPHVIISDIGMPEEDGYSFIRRLRILPDVTKKDIPAIALTAFARNEDRTQALLAGFNLHMAKPVEPKALVRAVVELAGPVR
jgi:signal transduction histidine kinase/ActR/RegA family two-component response regulator